MILWIHEKDKFVLYIFFEFFEFFRINYQLQDPRDKFLKIYIEIVSIPLIILIPKLDIFFYNIF